MAKLSLLVFTLLSLFVTLASSQYLSKGWTPGQPISAEPSAPTYVAGKPYPAASPQSQDDAETQEAGQTKPLSLSALFDLQTLLTSTPVASLFQRFGVNTTERLAGLDAQNIWDPRIPLITDNNFDEMIVNEQLTEEEEKERVWMLVITVTAAKQDGISKFVDETFDIAFNETQIAGDLPHVKWGRIDYLNVTAITTRWVVWQAPVLVVLKDRGRTLRFYQPQHIRLRGGALREFLRQDGWKVTAPWSSIYAPGGEREYLMIHFANALTKSYNTVNMIPRWLLFILSGAAASFIVNLLHTGFSSKPKKQTKPATVTQGEKKTNGNTSSDSTTATGSTTAVAASESRASPIPSPSKRAGGKGKKGKK